MTEENVDTKAESKKKSEGNAIWETVSVIVQALILALVLRTFLFQPFSIPSGSMKPTLLVGDYLFVSKFSYGYSKYSMPFAPDLFSGRIWAGEPTRGDIAVFKYPPNPNIDYIKRIIGFPGDKIQVSEGILYINGKAVERKRAGLFTDDDTGQIVQSYVETLPNGVSYTTLDINPRGHGDDTRVFEVPPDHYFVMGDNRDNSADSRFDAGFIPFENFVGRASVIFFSIRGGQHPLAIWRWPQDVRFERIFDGL